MQTRAQASPLILSLGLVGFVVMADSWVVSPIIPAISRDIGESPIRTTAIITAYLLPFGLFQLVFGPLADRYGKIRVMRIMLIGFTITCALTAFGVGITDLIIYRALTGMFAAATIPISLALIGDTVRMEERQVAIGSFMGIIFLGQGLSMGIGGAIAFLLSWREVFLAYATLSVVVTALLILRSRNLAIHGNPNSELLAPYWRMLTQGRSLRTYIVAFVEGALITGSFSYAGAFLSHQFGLDNLSIGAVTTAFGVAAIIGGRKSGAVSARLGRQRTLFLGFLIAGVGDGLLALMGATLPAVILGIAGLGGGFMLAHSAIVTIVT